MREGSSKEGGIENTEKVTEEAQGRRIKHLRDRLILENTSRLRKTQKGCDTQKM